MEPLPPTKKLDFSYKKTGEICRGFPLFVYRFNLPPNTNEINKILLWAGQNSIDLPLFCPTATRLGVPSM